MSTFYKTINIDISKHKVPLNFTMRTDCPDCGTECVHDFKTQPLKFPAKDQLVPVDFACPGCQTQFKVPAKIQNIRLVLAFDKDKKRKK